MPKEPAKWLEIAVWGLGLAFAVGSFYNSAGSSAARVGIIENKVDDVAHRVDGHDVALAAIHEDLVYIKQGIDEMRGKR